MDKSTSALRLAHAIQFNLAQSEEERKKSKREAMERWRAKHPTSKKPKTQPDGEARARRRANHTDSQGGYHDDPVKSRPGKKDGVPKSERDSARANEERQPKTGTSQDYHRGQSRHSASLEGLSPQERTEKLKQWKQVGEQKGIKFSDGNRLAHENQTFKVSRPFDLDVLKGHKPSNSYYGSSQLFDPVHERVTVEPGSRLHCLSGGKFLEMPDGTVEEFAWPDREKKGHFERSYGPDNDYLPTTHVEVDRNGWDERAKKGHTGMRQRQAEQQLQEGLDRRMAEQAERVENAKKWEREVKPRRPDMSNPYGETKPRYTREQLEAYERKRDPDRYPTKTTPEASAEAKKLKARSTPEGRKKAEGLQMASKPNTKSQSFRREWGNDQSTWPNEFRDDDKKDPQVQKARDWPQCDRCGAKKAAKGGDSEPIVHQGNYLCSGCASKVGKASSVFYLADPVTESILRKQDDMPLYAKVGAGEEGNEDDGNYSNPNERPLYQKAGAWPDELWTNTDPEDAGKQGQRAMHDSESYYLNKGSGIEPGQKETCLDCEQGKHGKCSVFCDCSCAKTNKAVRARLMKMNDWYANGGQIDAADFQELPRPKVDEAELSLHEDAQGSTEHHKKKLGGRESIEHQVRTMWPGTPEPVLQRMIEMELNSKKNAKEIARIDREGGLVDPEDDKEDRALVRNHVDGEGSTEHHKGGDPGGAGHAKNNPPSCIYCGRQNGHAPGCDRPTSKALDLSFLSPLMKGTEMIDAGILSPGAAALTAPTGMHHMENADGEREGHLVITAEDELEITDGHDVFELPSSGGVTININLPPNKS